MQASCLFKIKKPGKNLLDTPSGAQPLPAQSNPEVIGIDTIMSAQLLLGQAPLGMTLQAKALSARGASTLAT